LYIRLIAHSLLLEDVKDRFCKRERYFNVININNYIFNLEKYLNQLNFINKLDSDVFFILFQICYYDKKSDKK